MHLQKPFKGELERLQQQDLITSLGVNEMVEWCTASFSYPNLMPKSGCA